jgi:quinol-cytochrome oxidoreductase complex cytochrome b subunit
MLKYIDETLSRIWKSIFRHGWPVNARLRSEVIIWNIFFHIHPVKVYRETLKFSKTLGLGLISLYLFIILTVTGILLMFYFIPYTERAYHDMHDLEFAVSFGMIIRNMHRWAAHGMVAVVFFHMCRVFYTAAYREPREFNWVLGVNLFILTLMLSLTGYLLPWDQLAFWATTIVSKIMGSTLFIGDQIKYVFLGGTIVGQNSLIRSYVMHVVVLPFIAGILIVVHFWRIRKDGGLARSEASIAVEKTNSKPVEDLKSYGLMNLVEGKTPQVGKEPEEMITTWPHLLFREVVLFIKVTIIIMGMSVLFDAPLDEIANPSVTPNPAKAPWYFLGVQELVSWGHPFWWGVFIPTVVVTLLMLIPYVDRGLIGTGVWFHPDRRIPNILFTVFVVVTIGLIIVGTFMRGPNWGFYWPWEEWTTALH